MSKFWFFYFKNCQNFGLKMEIWVWTLLIVKIWFLGRNFGFNVKGLVSSCKKCQNFGFKVKISVLWAKIVNIFGCKVEILVLMSILVFQVKNMSNFWVVYVKICQNLSKFWFKDGNFGMKVTNCQNFGSKVKKVKFLVFRSKFRYYGQKVPKFWFLR